ncbi:YqaE/Pmp3 family membrane protein [Billgrantia endophytica]|uniref:YqaE/Pmp3 family membrane protein n=1 Tax=Billgrantia endophytica TaxID=2033802 RepID=A0A2N7UE46_9GAMM|nr:YqaE/Pmp3 family membrane protein [Halomonas endophytica]PMR78732.1 YqaE/Pmp3 family membrane protein [Halomonas endophytica]
MDAREYMAKKGIAQGRDEERPNTLEEKAWQRAREAGGHQPRAGTPYDWEDWERYHGELAEGAEAIEQKIDREAHRHAMERGSTGGVQHFTPTVDMRHDPPKPDDEKDDIAVASPGLRRAFLGLGVLAPPVAVGLSHGGARRVATCLILTLLGWLPGVVYAMRWIRHAAR